MNAPIVPQRISELVIGAHQIERGLANVVGFGFRTWGNAHAFLGLDDQHREVAVTFGP